MLDVHGSFHECVTLVKQLIVPPRCGLKLRCNHAHAGFDQRQLWAIIEKKMDSWAKNTPYRRLNAVVSIYSVKVRNLPREEGWEAKEVDPVMSISLNPLNSEEIVPLFHSLFALFERTFFDTTCLQLWIDDDLAEAEVLLPLVDSFQGFVNLEKLNVGNDSLPKLLFPLLQYADSVLFPHVKILMFL